MLNNASNLSISDRKMIEHNKFIQSKFGRFAVDGNLSKELKVRKLIVEYLLSVSKVSKVK